MDSGTHRCENGFSLAPSQICRRITGKALIALLFALVFSPSSFAAIAFVQSGWSAPSATVTSTTATFASAQNAGDLNVVAIGWRSPRVTVSSVTDTMGNVYSLAVGPQTASDGRGQSIYYAKNIVAAGGNANIVTVTMSAAVLGVDLRIAEYSGVNTTAPLDVASGAAGNSASLDSGTATTTNANDLLVGATYVQNSTTGVGSGYTQRLLTTNGSNLQDKIVTSTGPYNATATQSTGNWVMQMVAFKGASDTQAPTAPTNVVPSVISSTQINLSWTASTDNVGVDHYRVDKCVGTSCAFSTPGPTTTATTFNNTGLTASTTYSFQVVAFDAAGNNTASIRVTATTQAAPTAPAAPTNLHLIANSNKEIDIAWTASISSGVTGYKVEHCAGAGCSNFSAIAGSPTPATIAYDASLSGGTSYSYRVRAVGSGGLESTNATLTVSTLSNPTNNCD